MSRAEQIAKRLCEDYPFYAEKALVIRNKLGENAPLALNRAQTALNEAAEKMLAEVGYVRLIVLKGRQMGLSTTIGGRIFWRVANSASKKAMVVTHHADATNSLFDMVKRFHDQLPEPIKPSTRYNNKRQLAFDVLDSSYVVATAGADTVGRGETLNYLHASEVAFWPAKTAASIFNGLTQAVPMVRGSEAYIESTANGMVGLFRQLWVAAESGDSAWRGVFLPWFWEPGYRSEVAPDFERTHYEELYAAEVKDRTGHVIADEQLMFRRFRISESSEDIFRQEYPSWAEEAFLTTGRPVFHPLKLEEQYVAAPKKPARTYTREGSKWVEFPNGELAEYLPYDASETYTIGADIGMGVSKDFSVACVLDSDKRQVAVWRGQADPDLFAYVLRDLGARYNHCKIIPESNAHGLLTCTRLFKDLGYSNIWKDVVYLKETDQYTERLGFSTNASTRPMIIDGLRADVREGNLVILDRTTLEEMRTFVVTPSGKMAADAGCFDDCVLALSLANHGHEAKWTPITNDGLYLDLGE